MAIQIIEKFLHENKLRLIDLFRSVDKDKDWKVSRDEFRTAILKVSLVAFPLNCNIDFKAQ